MKIFVLEELICGASLVIEDVIGLNDITLLTNESPYDYVKRTLVDEQFKVKRSKKRIEICNDNFKIGTGKVNFSCYLKLMRK